MKNAVVFAFVFFRCFIIFLIIYPAYYSFIIYIAFKFQFGYIFKLFDVLMCDCEIKNMKMLILKTYIGSSF